MSICLLNVSSNGETIIRKMRFGGYCELGDKRIMLYDSEGSDEWKCHIVSCPTRGWTNCLEAKANREINNKIKHFLQNIKIEDCL